MFKSARVKLALWYLVITMSISIMFSIAIYKVLTNEIERLGNMQRFRLSQPFQKGATIQKLPPIFSVELVKETEHRILYRLILINIGIGMVTGGLGYILAGRTLRPIKEMVEEQQRFISDASHELRTPLTSLKSSFEVYLRGKNHTTSETRQLIEESINEVDKLQLLSESLLQLARFETPDKRLSFQSLLVDEIILESIKQIQPSAKQKQIQISYSHSPFQIEGNQHDLVNLFIILLDNAIKYSQEKTTVTVKSKEKNRCVFVYVQDQGIGIDKKDTEHIFDRFYRADAARSKQNIGGYGLGLSIAKKIVDTHHGSIEVKSQLKKGTTFIVRLPQKQSLT